MAYGEADSVVGKWLKRLGWCLVAFAVGAVLLVVAGIIIYALVYIVSLAWHSGT